MILIKSYSCISDVRIRKIIYSLVKNQKKVCYSGTYQCKEFEYFKYDTVNYKLIKRNKSILNLLVSSYFDFCSLVKLKKGDSLYIIDDVLAIILYPLLWYLKFKKVNLVLDLFDSLYLKYNRNLLFSNFLNIIYYPFNVIIVTDDNRKEIMNNLKIGRKIISIENFPFYSTLPNANKPKEGKINLLFYGSLSQSRGWGFIEQFANDDRFTVYLAGWDFLNIDLNSLPKNFLYLGLKNQDEIFEIMNSIIHWVFCLYEPINDNNINASPNKFYDAIHTGCGVIVNSEVKMSQFIKNNNLGIVIESYYDKAELYIDKIVNCNFQIIESEDKILSYSFNKYNDFYKSL